MKKGKKQKWFKISYMLLLIVAVISVSMNIRAGVLNPRFAVITGYDIDIDDDCIFYFLDHGYVPFVNLPYPYVINEEFNEENYLHWEENSAFWSTVIRKVHKVYLYNNDPSHILLRVDDAPKSLGTNGDFYREDFTLPNRKDNEINRIVLSGKRNGENIMLPAISIEDKKVIQRIFNSVQDGKKVPFTIEEVTQKMKPEDYEGYYEMYIEYKDYPIVEILGNLTMENDKVMIEWATRDSEQEIKEWPQAYYEY